MCSSVLFPSYVPAIVLDALRAIELGRAKVVTFLLTTGGKAQRLSVGAVWVNGVYSWRASFDGYALDVQDSNEILAGAGDAGEAALATGSLCLALGKFMGIADWTIRQTSSL